MFGLTPIPYFSMQKTLLQKQSHINISASPQSGSRGISMPAVAPYQFTTGVVQRDIKIKNKSEVETVKVKDLTARLKGGRVLKGYPEKVQDEVIAEIILTYDGNDEPVTYSAIEAKAKKILSAKEKEEGGTKTTGKTDDPTTTTTYNKALIEEKLLGGIGAITVGELKYYLDFEPSQVNGVARSIAIAIREETYDKPKAQVNTVDTGIAITTGEGTDDDHKAEATDEKEKESQLTLLRKEAKRQNKEEKEKWAAPETQIPSHVIDSSRKKEMSKAQKQLEKDNRSIPPEYVKKETVRRLPEEIKRKREELQALLPNISAEDSQLITALAVGPISGGLEYLFGLIEPLLKEIDDKWHLLKPAGKQALTKLASSSLQNLGDAKGLIGELNAIAFAISKEGVSEINTGGDDKKLPGEEKIGNTNTQDIDIRYLEPVNEKDYVRSYVEAKYDAKTLIGKYADIDEALKKSHQQARYEAYSQKALPTSGKVTGRKLYANIANTHDWLLLFIPGSTGISVTHRLTDAGWTIVIGRRALTSEEVYKLIPIVKKICYADKEKFVDETSLIETTTTSTAEDKTTATTSEEKEKSTEPTVKKKRFKPEDWAEANSNLLTPDELLAKKEIK